MRVAICGFYFENTVSQFKNGNIERTSTQIEHGNFQVFALFVQTISQSSGSRFVYNTTHIQSCDFAGLFRSLTLRIVEVCRHSDHRIGNFCSQIIFGSLSHLLKNDSRNFLGRVKMSVDIYTRRIILTPDNLVRYLRNFVQHLIILATHKSFDRRNCPCWIYNCLTFRRVAHFPLSIIQKGYYRRRCSFPFIVGDNNRIIPFHYCNTGIRST